MLPSDLDSGKEPQSDPTRPQEDWFQHLQRLRAEREASEYPFMDEEETNAHLKWLREGDRIDEMLGQADDDHQKQERG